MADEQQGDKFTYGEAEGELNVWVNGQRMPLSEFQRRKDAGELSDADLD